MTAQISDVLTFEGRPFPLSCEPLGTWLARPKNKNLRFNPTSSACWRGYVAKWIIHNGRLFLKEISGTLRDGQTAIPEVLLQNYSKQYLDSMGSNDPANAGPGVFAFWVSGVLTCSFGRMVKYVHLDYASTYAGELHLIMKNGFLVGQRIVHHEWPNDADTLSSDFSDLDVDTEYPNPPVWKYKKAT